MPSETIYIRLRKRVKVPRGRPIFLTDIAQFLSPPQWDPILRELVLHRPIRGDGNLILIDMLSIVAAIRERLPDAAVEHYGEPHTLVEIRTERKSAGWLLFAVVWLLLFFGSGLAIMNFHEDVSMPEVQRRIVYLITGKHVEHPYMFQIPYSIGIGLGMVVFFNHLFKKKINEEPSPLDVEIFKYEESVLQYVVTEEYKRLSENGQAEGRGKSR
ncbi:stage V sporulation protein AA [Paenibacillus thermotolerans]|uniref:stage V sporulation protein AA n=1 Tax=Paenibacillus thermotolerans TaxID=3027807 RepID=UPI002368AE99|nr:MULTISPECIES: stage V sporulation protein AA [unclassified Paenibacillus]